MSATENAAEVGADSYEPETLETGDASTGGSDGPTTVKGSVTVKAAPRGSTLRTRISPPCSLTMP